MAQTSLPQGSTEHLTWPVAGQWVMLRRNQQFTVSEEFLEALQVKMVTVHIKTVINAWGIQHIPLNLGLGCF